MDLKSLFSEVTEELQQEAESGMSSEEKHLHAVAQKLLRLERDLKATGSHGGEEARIQRLLDTIDQEQF